jgi:nucleotide-binding universal stress UspA family protein
MAYDSEGCNKVAEQSSSPNSSLPPERFSRILVAIDGSEKSLNAARYSIVLAKKDDAEVIALRVAPLPVAYDLSPSLIERRRELAIAEAEASFDKIRTYIASISKTTGKKIKLKTDLAESAVSVEATIVNYAEKEKVDLIVIGTRGLSGLKKLLLGSVATGVVTYATKPVLVVK